MFTKLPKPAFKRRSFILKPDRKARTEGAFDTNGNGAIAVSPEILADECTVLVVNSSYDMAKEITMQITLSMPHCSIMYAPTLELAKLILLKRRIHLVVASSMMPDGGILGIRSTLARVQNPPDMIVVGALSTQNSEMLSRSGYQLVSARRVGSLISSRKGVVPEPAPASIIKHKDAIKTLGADIRNDLNNPLQAIVAMVFVAKSATAGVLPEGTSPATAQALEAIDRAAQGMAKVVNGLEEKIRQVVDIIPQSPRIHRRGIG
jgi:hypothetical protein